MINFNKKTKPAFTMIELVFVIVVLGILAALALPRLDREIRQEAADNILSAIRYTQHLALNDNKHMHNTFDWQKRLWTISFIGNSVYTVYSDTIAPQGGLPNDGEMAIDPTNGKLMGSRDTTLDTTESPNVFLGDTYGIDAITFTGCATPAGTAATDIAFDYLGRPHRNVATATNIMDTYVNTDCVITFSSPAFTGDPIIIDIQRETGYATIRNQNDS